MKTQHTAMLAIALFACWMIHRAEGYKPRAPYYGGEPSSKNGYLTQESRKYYDTVRWSKKHERAYNTGLNTCKTTVKCRKFVDDEKVIDCARKCMSPECYRTYFADYEMEEGEVDTRLNQFKRCYHFERAKMAADSVDS